MKCTNSKSDMIKHLENVLKDNSYIVEDLIEKEINDKSLMSFVEELIHNAEIEKKFNTIDVKLLISELNFKVNSGMSKYNSIGFEYTLIQYVDFLYAVIELYENKLELNGKVKFTDDLSSELNSIYSSIESFSEIITGVTFVEKKTNKETYIVRRSDMIEFINKIDINKYKIKISRYDTYDLSSSSGAFRMKDRYNVNVFSESFDVKHYVENKLSSKKTLEEFHSEILSIIDYYSSFDELKTLSSK